MSAKSQSLEDPRRGSSRRGRLSASARGEQILGAARRVFLDNGFAGARTKDIAAEAGVNEALVYRHFASKEQLFEAAIVEPLDALVDGLLERASSLDYDPRPDRQRELTAEFIENLLRAMVEMAPMLGVVLFGDLEAGRTFYCERILPAIQVVEAAVQAALATFDHRTFPVRTAVNSTVWACFGLALDARFRQSSLRPDHVAEELTALLFAGILPPVSARDT